MLQDVCKGGATRKRVVQVLPLLMSQESTEHARLLGQLGISTAADRRNMTDGLCMQEFGDLLAACEVNNPLASQASLMNSVLAGKAQAAAAEGTVTQVAKVRALSTTSAMGYFGRSDAFCMHVISIQYGLVQAWSQAVSLIS